MTSKSWTEKSRKRPPEIGDVGLMGRGRIVAGQAEGVERPDLARLDQPSGLAVAGVEPALEADLDRHARRLDLARRRRSCWPGRWPRGFSQNVGMPRAMPARMSAAWASVAAAMTSASALARASSIDALRAPTAAATSVARTGSTSATVNSTSGRSDSNRACRRPIRPAPRRLMRTRDGITPMASTCARGPVVDDLTTTPWLPCAMVVSTAADRARTRTRSA